MTDKQSTGVSMHRPVHTMHRQGHPATGMECIPQHAYPVPTLDRVS